ncbi:hypothetical protein CULT_1450001 [[Clostridium] ultunense Esp]|nr:hypothetical protein CULT_1450001 [[Clostridium] ultunense Esp]
MSTIYDMVHRIGLTRKTYLVVDIPNKNNRRVSCYFIMFINLFLTYS